MTWSTVSMWVAGLLVGAGLVMIRVDAQDGRDVWPGIRMLLYGLAMTALGGVS